MVKYIINGLKRQKKIVNGSKIVNSAAIYGRFQN